MAQHDGVIDDANGLAFLGDLNDYIASARTNNSGASEPVDTAPYMWWPDTTDDLLKQRNAADTAWITICKLSTWAMPNSQTQLATRATTAGTAPTYTATQAPVTATAKVVNASIHSSTLSGASTLAVNGGSAQGIKQYNSAGSKVDAILVAGMRAVFEDDGTHWILMNPLPPTGSIAAGSVGVTELATLGKGLGCDQTLQDMTASRAYGVTYTNTTGRVILITVSGYATASGNVSAIINGSTFTLGSVPAASSLNHSLCVPVPIGATYRVNGPGTPTLSIWLELR